MPQERRSLPPQPPKETRMFRTVPMEVIAHMLKTLPVPITITPQVRERDGKPYYTYQVGTITEQRPFGLCKGATPDFLQAVSRSLEVAIQHANE